MINVNPQTGYDWNIKINPQTGFVYDDGPRRLWLPPINRKQFEIFNDFHRYTLVTGCRKGGKTIGVEHKLFRHAYDCDGAKIGIISRTIKNAKGSGIWTELTETILPIWLRAGIKMKMAPNTNGKAMGVTGDTKMSYLRVTNRHNTVSEIQLHSVENANEVEDKFKGTRFSMWWISELDRWDDRFLFDICTDQMRIMNIPYEQHQFIADCNPPATGENNCWHDLFFKTKINKASPNYPMVNDLHVIQCGLDDNPQLDPRERRELEVKYGYRESLRKRFVEGLWTQDMVDGHFSDVYDENTHVRGKTDCPEEDREFLVPTDGCTHLLSGWDMGESKNHSFHIIEKIINEHPVTKRQHISFSVLDEFVVIRTYMSIREFVAVCMERIAYWQEWQLKHQNVQLKWRHWSDTSAFREHASADKCDAAIVYEASDGRIDLQGAPKYRESNRDKVKLLWQLLYEKRLFISAQLAATRAMLVNLRSDPNSAAHFVKRDDHKHPFDSLAYPIIAEAPTDMMKSAEITTAKREPLPGLIVARM